jgi:hypothetical protein
MEKRTSGTLGRAAIIWIAATCLMFPAFAFGHIISDNSFTNVNWSEGFARQLFSGHVYPRWLPDMNAGAGSPVFYFYGPLPFYLTAPFHLILDSRHAVLVGMWLMLGLSGLAFQALADSAAKATNALVAALAYMVMPYHFFVDIWLRSDLGELGAYIFMPLCLLCVLRLASGPVWTFALGASMAGLLLSHLPIALLFAPFLTAFCLYCAIRDKSAAVLVRGTTGAILGLGLAAAYVVPAMSLQGLIHADRWNTYLPADNLLFARLRFAFELFLDAGAIITATLVMLYGKGLVSSAMRRCAILWIAFAVGALFVTSPLAFVLWKVLPPLFDKIQFAWRALALLDIAFCMLLALALEANIWRRKIVLRVALFGLAAVVALFLVYQGKKGNYAPTGKLLAYENVQIARHAETLEYLPSCRPFQSGDMSEGTSALIVDRVLWERPPDELPVFYYPFLDVKFKGLALATRCDPKTGFIVVGRKTGPFAIETHRMAPERLGTLISVTSLSILLLVLFFSTRTRFATARSDEPLARETS